MQDSRNFSCPRVEVSIGRGRRLMVAWKRVISAAVGGIAILAGLVASNYAILAFEDFKNPAVPTRLAVLDNLIMWSIAAALVGLGVRFLRFAWLGSSSTSDG